MPPDQNPFAILTLIAAPAVLTNAASLLALGTSNRFARNIDRSRAIIKILETHSAGGTTINVTDEVLLHRKLLDWMERRMRMLMRAMSLFYFAIGCFAAGSLTALLGAIVASTEHAFILDAIMIVALIAGVAGLGGLIVGGALLVQETRLALTTIREEMQFYRARHNR